MGTNYWTFYCLPNLNYLTCISHRYLYGCAPKTLSSRTSTAKTSTSKTLNGNNIDWWNHQLSKTSIGQNTKNIHNWRFYSTIFSTFYGLINLCQLKIELNIRKTECFFSNYNLMIKGWLKLNNLQNLKAD